METVKIELGKFYLISKVDNTDVTDVIQILGEVLLDTLEYTEGKRFYDNYGRYLDEHGFKDNTLKVIKEVKSLSRNGLDYHYFSVKLDDLNDNPKYISSSDKSFKMSIGESYVNRKGQIVLIDTLRECLCTNPKCGIFSFLGPGPFGPFTVDGRTVIAHLQKSKSMDDLIYQKIG